MQPIRLRHPPHQYHIPTPKQHLKHLRALWLPSINRFMLEQKVPPRTQRQTRNSRIGAQKSLVIGMVGYAVGSGGVVVDEAKVVGAACGFFGDFAEDFETLRKRTGWNGGVFWFATDLCACCCVDWSSFFVEAGRGVETENGGETGSYDICGYGTAVDGVADSVEGQA